MSKKIILNNDQLNLSLDRLACQLTENHDDFKDTVLVGLQPRGKSLCENIVKILLSKYKINTVDHGFLDITFLEMISEGIKIFYYQIKMILNY